MNKQFSPRSLLHIRRTPCPAPADRPVYPDGTVCISILSLSLVVFIVQRQYLVRLNKKKINVWNSMTAEEKVEYQTNNEAREADGNKRLDFRFAY